MVMRLGKISPPLLGVGGRRSGCLLLPAFQSPNNPTTLIVNRPSNNRPNCKRCYASSSVISTSNALSAKCLGSADSSHRCSPPAAAASGLREDRMPRHVGLALKQQQGQGDEYHKYVLLLADLCVELGIPTASCFNLNATQTTLNGEAGLFWRDLEQSLKDNLGKFIRQGIRVVLIGDKSLYPKSLQEVSRQVEEATKNGKTLELIYAAKYGGRWDITQAARSIGHKVRDGLIKARDIDDALLDEQLSTGGCGCPNPDLMIITGGSYSFSDTFLWQNSYAELYFADSLGPDDARADLTKAVAWFQQIDRRFGK